VQHSIRVRQLTASPPRTTYQVAEPAESVRLAVTDYDGVPLPGSQVVPGTVVDAP